MTDAENPSPGPSPEKGGEEGILAPSPPSVPGKGAGGFGSLAVHPRWLAAAIAVVVTGGIGVGLWYAFARGGSKDDLTQFQGVWSYSANGRNNLGSIRVEGDTWTYLPVGYVGKSYRITLRPDTSPKEIDLSQLGEDGKPVAFTHGAGKGAEVNLHGVYAFGGNEVRVVLAPGVEPRPHATDDSSTGAQVLTLARVKQ